MATLIVEDGGGVSGANSYATVADAETYHDNRLHSQVWMEASEQQERALIWATRLLDEHCWWLGWPSYSTQALGWPRAGVAMVGGAETIASTVIPLWLKSATAELARLLIERDRPLDAEWGRVASSSSGGRSRSLGLSDAAYKAVLPPSVRSIVGPYTVRGVSRLVRAA